LKTVEPSVENSPTPRGHRARSARGGSNPSPSANQHGDRHHIGTPRVRGRTPLGGTGTRPHLLQGMSADPSKGGAGTTDSLNSSAYPSLRRRSNHNETPINELTPVKLPAGNAARVPALEHCPRWMYYQVETRGLRRGGS